MGEFEWFMTEDDLKRANEDGKDRWFEDDIYGNAFYRTDNGSYLIDIHYEKYDGKRFYFAVYEDETPAGFHGEWLDDIREIKSATNFKRFKNRAEKMIINWVNDFERG